MELYNAYSDDPGQYAPRKGMWDRIKKETGISNHYILPLFRSRSIRRVSLNCSRNIAFDYRKFPVVMIDNSKVVVREHSSTVIAYSYWNNKENWDRVRNSTATVQVSVSL